MTKGKYQPDVRETAKFLNGPEVGEACLEVAKLFAGNAQAVGRSEYEALPAAVTGGWRNERRAGATVRETKPDGRDSRDAILLRVAEAMEGGK